MVVEVVGGAWAGDAVLSTRTSLLSRVPSTTGQHGSGNANGAVQEGRSRIPGAFAAKFGSHGW